ESEGELPISGEAGDAFLIGGDLYVWTGEDWENVGTIQGPQGEKGDKGDPGDPGAAGADGADGREVELQTSATHVQWRYVGETEWTDLVALSAITGPAGADGADGADGATGAPGADGEEVSLRVD